MKKFFLTGDLEYTANMGESLNLSSIRNDSGYAIKEAFNQNVKTEIISYANIIDYFESMRTDDEFILTLDGGVYGKNADAFFDATRVYDCKESITTKPKCYTIMQRDGSPLDQQINNIVEKINSSGKKKVTIIDDGIFSGDTLRSIIARLTNAGQNVSKIRVVLNFSGKKDFGGIKIENMHNLPINSIIDWLDERDLYYGVEMGGASFFDKNIINGAPYISSTTLAEKKASIPAETSLQFCKNMIGLNKRLYELIEFKNHKTPLLVDFKRLSYLQKNYSSRDSIQNILTKEKQFLAS